jgi:flagellar basal body rod protein FlgG
MTRFEQRIADRTSTPSQVELASELVKVITARRAAESFRERIDALIDQMGAAA